MRFKNIAFLLATAIGVSVAYAGSANAEQYGSFMDANPTVATPTVHLNQATYYQPQHYHHGYCPTPSTDVQPPVQPPVHSLNHSWNRSLYQVWQHPTAGHEYQTDRRKARTAAGYNSLFAF